MGSRCGVYRVGTFCGVNYSSAFNDNDTQIFPYWTHCGRQPSCSSSSHCIYSLQTCEEHQFRSAQEVHRKPHLHHVKRRDKSTRVTMIIGMTSSSNGPRFCGLPLLHAKKSCWSSLSGSKRETKLNDGEKILVRDSGEHTHLITVKDCGDRYQWH